MLGQVSGDNLGMYGLFGFVENFSGNYPYRFCVIHKNNLQQTLDEDVTLLRSKDSHNGHVLKNIANNNNATSTSTFGVMKESPLNMLTYFHVTDNYTPDLMHDLLEGACGYELKLILRELIFTNKLFDLDFFNEGIRCFNYSPSERESKPVAISVSHLKSPEGVIKQSASEIWCLMTNLPIIIGDKVPCEDSHWELLLSPLDIMSIVFASAITEGSTYYLQSLITNHLQMFVQLFPNHRLRPKQHFLTHYPRCIRLVGPLIRFWCMRFEAKHNFFRRLSHIVCNFRNVCKTMATRHQLMQCYNFYTQKSIDSQSVQVGPGSVIFLADVDHGQAIASLLGKGVLEDIFLAKWVRIHGVLYRSEMFLVLAVNSEGCPIFCQIKHVFVIAGIPYFAVEQWQSDHFDRHYYAYCINKAEPAQMLVLCTQALLDYYPLHAKKSYDANNSNTYLVMRHKPWY